MLSIASIPAFLLTGNLLAQEEMTEDDDVYELSPFVVATDEQSGYLASSTLAGTRIKTDVKDVGAAVSIYTEEFLDDINGTNLETVLTFTANTEVAGADGNFSGSSGGEDNTSTRVETSQSNRVRGLANATLTRNFFATDIPFDSYNSGQLTIVRGPNSILAGAGAPGGIIDGATRNAVFNDSTKLSLRYGKNSSYRGVFNLNREVIADRLAVRLDLLSEDRNFRQDPAYEKDQRAYFAANAKFFEGNREGLLSGTNLRVSFETGKIEGTPPNPLPPMISFSGWFSESDVGKWWLDGHTRTRYAGDNATGAFSPGQSFTPPQAAPSGFVEGFPLYAQAAIIFSDPNRDDASLGHSGLDLSALQGFQGVANPGGGFLRGTGDFNRTRAGFTRTRLQDRNVFDFYNHLMTGEFDFRTQEFDAVNVALEQLFWNNKAGVEYVYDSQSYELNHDIPIRGNDTEIFIDVNRTLSVLGPDGEPILNPNFSRPFIVSRDAFGDVRNERDRETHRLTAFIGHDFRDTVDGWLGKVIGRHTLSGLFQDTTNEIVNESFKSSWPRFAGDYDMAQSVGTPGTFRSQVNAWFYVGDPMINAASASDIRLTPIRTARPEIGQTYSLQLYQSNIREYKTVQATPQMITNSYRELGETFESLALAHQAHWFDDHLVTLVSYREDTSNRSIGAFGTQRDDQGNGDLTREDFFITEDPELTIGSWTRSVVLRVPERWFTLPFDSDLRVFWNESENFTPAGARRNIYNEDVGPPSATTEEWGLNLSTLGGKLDARLTFYETQVDNASVSAGGNPYNYLSAMITRLTDAHNGGLDVNDPAWGWDGFGFNSFIDAANAFINALPDRLQVGEAVQFNPNLVANADGSYTWNPASVPQYTSTSSTVSEGLELEIVYNPTRNWRIAASVARQEAVRAGVAALELGFAESFLNNITSTYGPDILEAGRNPAIGAGVPDFPWIFQYNNEHLFGIQKQGQLSGSSLAEVAEWNASLVTRYEFTDGFLKGFRLGGSVRWRDSAAIGFPNTVDANGNTIADVDNPIFGEDDLRADLNLSYQRDLTLLGRDVDWTIQLYVSNLVGSQDLIATFANPDGSIGQVRIPPERSWSITNTISF